MDENKKTEIVEKIKALKDSPLYAMSLGGRELYHSNFWAWLMEQDSQFINVFFEGSFDGEKPRREEKHHDLTIRDKNGKIHIIENKIKSLATKEQLDRYLFDMFNSYVEVYKYIKNKDISQKTEKYQKLTETASILRSLSDYLKNNKDYSEEIRNMLDKDMKKVAGYIIDEIKKASPDDKYIKTSLLLTGLLDSAPTFITENNWNYKSYITIIKDIMDKLKDSNIDDISKKIVEKYCDDVKKLSYLINTLLKDSKTDYSFGFAEMLEDIRYDDTYKKLKMEDFANTVDLDKIGERQKDKFDLKKEVEFSNKHAILTIKYEKIDKNGRSQKKYAIGIQIEEYAFRYFVEAPGLATETFTKNNAESKTFDQLVGAGWFVNRTNPNSMQEKGFHGKSLDSQGDPCNKYEPNFIYQHYNLNNLKETIKYNDVCNEIYNAFKSDAFSKAFKIIKDKSNQK